MAPPRESSKWADAGTAAHSVGEQCLSTGRAPFEFYGQSIEVNGQTYKVDAEVVVAVSHYVSHVRAHERELGPDVRRLVERRLWLDEIGNGGTVDCLLVAPRKIHVHDYKHGQGVYVSEAWNAQFLAYGVAGARANLPHLPIEQIEFTFAVHQPRFDGTEPCRTQTLPGDAVRGWLVDTLVPALEAGKDPNTPLRAGEHCRFCPAKAICVEYLSAPRKQFGYVPIKAEPVPSGFVF